MQIPILTIFFILFLIFISYRFKKSDQDQADADHRFWEKEIRANATRKKDISNIDYIIIPENLFPLNLHTDTERTIVTLKDKRMLNLTGMTNADVKIKYGMPNFDEISSYEENFSQFIRLVPLYAQELIEAGQTDEAQKLLEFAIDCKADSRTIFSLLSQLYIDKGSIKKVEGLKNIASEFSGISRELILKDLDDLLEEN